MGRGLRVVALSGLVVAHLTTAAAAGTIWYEDNNLGRGGNMPDDFVEKFRKPETFARATKYMDVYLLRANVLQKMDDAFFTELLLPYLKNNRIKFAINAGGATWLGATERRQQIFEAELKLYERIKQLGGQVDYISLQSILSKPRRMAGRGTEIVEFSLENRVAGAVTYARAVQKIFPDAAIGIIDALPSKGMEYRESYQRLARAMQEASLKLSYVHLDLSFEGAKKRRYGTGWPEIREIERYLEDELKVQFGLFVKSRRAGETSSKEFRDSVIAMLQCYAGSGGSPREYVFASWFKHPEKTIPENATGADYPMMRILLDLGEEFRRIEDGAQGWVAQRQADPIWRRQCGLRGG